MNSADAYLVVVLYLLGAVFYGFVPMALLSGQVAGTILQVLCIGGVISLTWRKLTFRGVTLDNRIGLAFVAYIVSTAATNLIWWLLQRSAK